MTGPIRDRQHGMVVTPCTLQPCAQLSRGTPPSTGLQGF